MYIHTYHYDYHFVSECLKHVNVSYKQDQKEDIKVQPLYS